jgi:hypothetical protein
VGGDEPDAQEAFANSSNYSGHDAGNRLNPTRGFMKEERKGSIPLSEFIQTHRRNIIEEWVEFARTLQPWAKGLTKKDLEDHDEELLDAIVSDMKSPQSSSQQAEKSKGRERRGALSRVGKKHAIDRLESGLKLDQLVSEYRASGKRAPVVGEGG